MLILATKLYIPTPIPKLVLRPHLIECLNQGINRKLTLISAPAGFGKTTLISEWVAGCKQPVAWFSIDQGDNDSIRFLTYLVSALQTIVDNFGQDVLNVLQSPQPPLIEVILTSLINEIANLTMNFTLVLDDYHVIDSKLVDDALAFLLEHLPTKMHIVITSREDPNIPLARLRVHNQLTEFRANDLRFTSTETAVFLNKMMGLNLTKEDISVLETRTEGWIAGLQLAAISMQGQKDTTNFIKAFTGSHHFVLDYLVEEVLQHQNERVQKFLLHTSILDRLCGPLCDAIMLDSSVSGQETLEQLERANLFIVHLDNERHWYRYHHLFVDLLRQRLQQNKTFATEDEGKNVVELHRRASLWYEENGMELEAFNHAVLSNNIDHATRLMEGRGMPLHFRGAVVPVLKWLKSLPKAVMDTRPSLLVMYASALSMTGQLAEVEQKLQAAEVALENVKLDEKARNLTGHIAAIRALLAATQNQIEVIIIQSQRALEYLHPDNLPVRTATIWKLGYAYQLQGDYDAATKAYTEAISISQASGNKIVCISATIALGSIHEATNQLDLAEQTYQRALLMLKETPMGIASKAHLGLARIFYQWKDLETAMQHGQQSLKISQQQENIEEVLASEIFLLKLKFAQSDEARTIVILDKEKLKDKTFLLPDQYFKESLTPREEEILQLIAKGMSNQEICEKLFLALDTVKGHNRRIYAKLQVQRRTEAVDRARKLGLL